MDIYILEWLAIQNIALHTFRHTFVQPLDANTIDDCINRAINDCDKDESCKIYTKSDNHKMCVNPKRIKHFMATEISTTFTGRNGKIYKIVDSVAYIDNEDQLYPSIYYYIILSVETTNIYVMCCFRLTRSLHMQN